MSLKVGGTTALIAEGVAVVALAAALAHAGSEHGATLIAGLFLGMCQWRSWRFDDARVLGDGLALGGLVVRLEEPLAALRRSVWWLLLAVVLTFPPFVVAWRLAINPVESFVPTRAFANLQPLAELALVALPEEAFFRGYLQSRLAESSSRRFGPLTHANLLASALFALGHFGTAISFARASVFFPSLLFGVLRERTGGIVVPMIFHALCNVLSRVLFQGFGLV
jgi:membrane protease YdiL (CAAX protease family)